MPLSIPGLIPMQLLNPLTGFVVSTLGSRMCALNQMLERLHVDHPREDLCSVPTQRDSVLLVSKSLVALEVKGLVVTF